MGFQKSPVAFLVSAVVTLTGCFGQPTFLKQETDNSNRFQTIGVATTFTDASVVSATIKADDPRSQIIKIDNVAELKGTSVIVPPGSLAMDVVITIEEASPLATTTIGQQLGISGQFAVTGTAVAIQANQDVTLIKPFGISLPIPGVTALMQNDPYANLFVIYKIKISETGEIMIGTLPRSELEITDGVVRFTTKHLGAFQVAFAQQPVEAIKVATTEPVVTKRDELKAAATSLALEAGALAKDGYINAAEANSSEPLFFVGSSSHKDVVYSKIISDDTLLLCDEKIDYDQKTIPAIKSIPAVDGSYAMCARVTDELKKPHYFKSPIIKKDITAPVVDVGADIPSSVAISSVNATSSGAVKWSWRKMSGPGNVSFVAAAAEDTSFSVDTPGNYVLKLSVEDEAGNVASDELNFAYNPLPIIHSVNLASGGASSDGYLNASEASDSSPLISVSASNHTTIGYAVVADNLICDGTLAYNATMPSSQDMPVSDGSYAVCVKVSNSGNDAFGKSPTIIRDLTAPAVSVGTNVTTSATFTRSAVTDGVSFSWSIVSGGPGSVTFSTPTAKSTSITASMDGSYVIRFTTSDAAGNQAQGDFTLTWSTVGPSFLGLNKINEAADGYINNSEIASSSALFLLNASNYVTAEYTLVLADSALDCTPALSYGSSSIPLINSIPAMDGAYAVCVKLTDAASNVIYGKSDTIVRDITAPTVDAGSDAFVSSTHNLDATTSGAIVFAWTKQSGSGIVTFGSPSTEDTTATADTDGVYTLRLSATDAAGNSAYDEVVLNWDTTAPVFTAFNKFSDAVDGYINDAEKGNATALWELDASGYTTAAYTGPLDETVAVNCDATKSYSLSTIPTAMDLMADKPYVICVQLTDSAGNITYGKSTIVIRDTVYPVFTSLQGSNEAIDGYINSNEATSTADMFTLNASGASIVQYSIVLADSALTCDGNKAYGASTIPMVNSTPGADGAYAVCVQLKDDAGNTIYGKSQTIVRDTMVPIVNAGPDASANAPISRTGTSDGISFLWSMASGPGTVNFSNPSSLTTGIDASVDGVYTIKLKAFDVAGNWVYDEFALTWDTSGPVFISLSLMNEASDGYVNANETSSALPLVNLNATDYSLAVYTAPLSLGVTPVCDGSLAYFPTPPMVNSIPPTDGDYKVCVKLTDSTSNITYGASPLISRDTSAPLVNLGPAVNHRASFVINPTISDGATYLWTKTSGTGTVSFSDSAVPAPTVSMSMDGPYVLQLTVSDIAGNVASGDIQVNWDTTPPVITSFVRVSEATDGYINAMEAPSGNPMFSLTGSGYDQLKYTSPLPQGAVCDQSQSYSPRSAPQPNELGVDGGYKVCVSLSDVAGNITYGSQTVEKDTVPPPGPLTFNAPKVILDQPDFTATVTGADVQKFSARIGPRAGVDCNNPSGYQDSTGPSMMIDQSAFPDGPIRLCVVAMDMAGNRQPYPNATAREWHKVTRSNAAIQIAAGDQHVCALFNNDKVRCWGKNTDGQLGYGSTTPIGTSAGQMGTNLLDVDLGPGVLVQQIAAGGNHTCALTLDGRVKCWGANGAGQLGIGTTLSKGAFPGEMGTNLPFLNLGTNVKAIKLALGTDHTCALLKTSEVKCWGDNTQSELGTGANNSVIDAQAAIIVDLGGKKAVDISAGPDRSCAVLDDHSIKCWGENTSEATGTVGSISVGGLSKPIGTILAFNPGSKKVLQVATGGYHTCALGEDHQLKCWGRGTEGQLGNGGSTDILSLAIPSSPPVMVSPGYIRQFALGFKHSCAIMDDFAVRCWGYNITGQLGAGGTGNQMTPVNVPVAKATQIAMGGDFTCAITANSEVSCWGGNSSGQLGQGNTTTQSNNPLLVSFGAPDMSVLSLASHTDHTCAILSDRSLRCWGNNANGQLGLGHMTNTGSQPNQMGAMLPPINFTGFKVMQVSVGAQHTCALLESGDMKCWGFNGYGQLGQQNTTMLPTPPSAPIQFGSGIRPVKIATGDHQSCALLPDSTVKCWGMGMSGSLGQGASTDIIVSGSELLTLPSINLGGPKVVDLVAHSQHVCAILTDRSMKCWGDNSTGQLGQPNMDNRGNNSNDILNKMGVDLPPINLGTNRKVISVALGAFHTCAILDDGSSKCFGANGAGQSGKPTVTNVGASALALGDYLTPIDFGSSMLSRFMTAGSDHTCTLLSGGVIKCFGMGAEGALGYESGASIGKNPGEMGNALPTVGLGSNRFVNQVVAGAAHTCALLDIGWIKCWGKNNSGQLGHENTLGQGAGVGTMDDDLEFVRLWW